MILSFYKLKHEPFLISSDPKFSWLGGKLKEALAVLKSGVIDSKGFLLLTGDVGTGKTTLINALLDSLGSDVIFAKIPDPKLIEIDFYRYIANVFRLKKTLKTKVELLFELTRFLEKALAEKKKVVLIIDEAQRLQDNILEEIRLLSNLEKEHVKLLNICFVGQIEFNEILLKRENEAIRQQIAVNYTLERLTENEVKKYIEYRLKVAGGKRRIFTEEAIHEIFLFSQGTPRLINIICDRALLTGFVEEKIEIDAKVIWECAEDLEIRPHPEGMINPPIEEEKKHGAHQSNPSVDTPKIEIEIPRVPRKRFSALVISLVYFVLLIVLLGIVAFFFLSPENFPFLDLENLLSLEKVAGGN